MSKLPKIEDLMDAGVHYGHQIKRWNPKMGQYIFTQRMGIHVIDLEKTEAQLKVAAEFIKKAAEQGATALFLATKKQAAENQRAEAAYRDALTKAQSAFDKVNDAQNALMREAEAATKVVEVELDKFETETGLNIRMLMSRSASGAAQVRL